MCVPYSPVRLRTEVVRVRLKLLLFERPGEANKSKYCSKIQCSLLLWNGYVGKRRDLSCVFHFKGGAVNLVLCGGRATF